MSCLTSWLGSLVSASNRSSTRVCHPGLGALHHAALQQVSRQMIFHQSPDCLSVEEMHASRFAPLTTHMAPPISAPCPANVPCWSLLEITPAASHLLRARAPD